MIIQLEEAKRELVKLDGDIDELGNAMKIEELKVNIASLEEKTLAPDFWNMADSSTILQQIKSMKDKVEAFSNLKKRCEDAVVLAESQAYTDAAKAEAIADAASKYETKGTAQGIVDGLKLGETYEPIGAEERAIAAAEAKVNELAGNVYGKEEVYTKAEVESLLCWGEF